MIVIININTGTGNSIQQKIMGASQSGPMSTWPIVDAAPN